MQEPSPFFLLFLLQPACNSCHLPFLLQCIIVIQRKYHSAASITVQLPYSILGILLVMLWISAPWVSPLLLSPFMPAPAPQVPLISLWSRSSPQSKPSPYIRAMNTLRSVWFSLCQAITPETQVTRRCFKITTALQWMLDLIPTNSPVSSQGHRPQGTEGRRSLPATRQWGWHLFSHLPTSASQGPETNVNLGAGLCRVTPGSVLLTLSPPSVWCPQKSVWFFGGYIVDQKAVMS